jgi:hypothetical protein
VTRDLILRLAAGKAAMGRVLQLSHAPSRTVAAQAQILSPAVQNP